MQQNQADEKGVMLHAEYLNIEDSILLEQGDQINSSIVSPFIQSDMQRIIQVLFCL